MTDTIENTTPTGTIEHVDPNALALEVNVRPDQMLNKQFIASIKENGVLEPILARRSDDGTLYVRAGARRTMAAIEAGLASVPVYVTDADDDTATRIIAQITENDHRLALRQIDRVVGIQTLLDTGLSVTKVAKKLAVSPERVKQSKVVAASQQALDAVAAGEVTLAEAAVLAEFEDDEDAVERLRRCAGRDWFEHEASRLRQVRKDRALYAVAKLGYETQGYQVLDEQPRPFDPEYVARDFLVAPEGQTIDPTAAPEHWAIIIDEDAAFTDKKTGEPVNEEDIDWNTERKPDAEPAEGMIHADSVDEETVFVIGEYYCRNPEALGLVTNDRFEKFSGQATYPSTNGSSVGSPNLDQQQVDDLATKRERRKVIALNKAGEAAQQVRREFVTKLLARKSPPKGAMLFVARVLASDGYVLANMKADETITDLFGVRRGAKSDISELVANAGTDARAAVLTLGMVLGALESRTPKAAWRSAGAGWQFAGSKEYLKFLAEQGYTLSAIEHVITGDRTADEVYDELVEEAGNG
jgi:ParB family chromosome partitioning protein